MAWHWRLIANSLPRSLPWLRVLQVTQCARYFGEGAARDRGEIFPARGQTEMHLINVWIVLAILLGLLAVTRLLRYDDVSHYEVFSESAVSQNLRGSPQCPNNISDEARFPNKMPRPAGD